MNERKEKQEGFWGQRGRKDQEQRGNEGEKGKPRKGKISTGKEGETERK